MANSDRIQKLVGINYETWFYISNLYNQWAQKFGMQENTLFVLYYILHNNSGCTQKDLCEKLVLPKQTISFILTKLEKDGLIYREPDPINHRNNLVKFTEYGKKAAEDIIYKLDTAEIKAFCSLSQEEQEIITWSLQKFAKALEKSFSET